MPLWILREAAKDLVQYRRENALLPTPLVDMANDISEGNLPGHTPLVKGSKLAGQIFDNLGITRIRAQDIEVKRKLGE